jgi:hypothetical protein
VLPPEIADLTALECLVLEGTNVAAGAGHLARLPRTCAVKYRT